jgi:crossover junction endodeoxyribonuclease RusA
VIRLTLPEPPSANRYYRMAGRHLHHSDDARAYIASVEAICRVQRVVPIRGPVGVRFTWYRGRRSGDLDNRLKIALDALQGFCFESDAQVVEITATRHDDKGKGRAEVEVYAVEPLARAA